MSKNKPKPPTWPPAHLSLPSLATLEGLSKPSSGPAVQQAPFPEAPENSKAVRLRRLLADVPGPAAGGSAGGPHTGGAARRVNHRPGRLACKAGNVAQRYPGCEGDAR
jgi:hypothetical protein